MSCPDCIEVLEYLLQTAMEREADKDSVDPRPAAPTIQVLYLIYNEGIGKMKIVTWTIIVTILQVLQAHVSVFLHAPCLVVARVLFLPGENPYKHLSKPPNEL